jgi:hypothetical protein
MIQWWINRKVILMYHQSSAKDHRAKWLETMQAIRFKLGRLPKVYLKALDNLNNTSGDMRG